MNPGWKVQSRTKVGQGHRWFYGVGGSCELRGSISVRRFITRMRSLLTARWLRVNSFNVPMPVIHRPSAAFTLGAFARWGRRACGEFVMRDLAGSLPSAFWQPDARSVPVGPQRCPCESRHHRTGLVTALTRSAWPELLVGLGIALMNADAAKEIYEVAREEHRATLL